MTPLFVILNKIIMNADVHGFPAEDIPLLQLLQSAEQK